MTVTDDELLDGSTSKKSLLTLAVLLMVSAAVGLTTMLNDALAPTFKAEASVQVTVRDTTLQFAEADTNETSVGSTSVTTTPVAFTTPTLPTLRV